MSQEQQEQVATDLSEFLPSRRATKKVNYNEKKADFELEKKIKALEKIAKTANNSSSNSKKKTPAAKDSNASNKLSSTTSKSNSGVKSSDSKTKVTKKTSNGKTAASSKTSSKDVKTVTDSYVNKILSDKTVAWNIIPSLPPAYRKQSKFSNMLILEDALVDVEKKSLYIPGHNGSRIEILLTVNEHIYMVSEPPGEPYYVGRIMDFVPKKEYHSKIQDTAVKVFPAAYFNMKMNWYYRQRDISENLNKVDSRMLYASLHTDVCPLHSFRGKCTVLHKDEVLKQYKSMDEYITKSNFFYFDQLFDRYTGEYYNLHNTKDLIENISIPEAKTSKYLSILCKMYPYIYCEPKFPLENFINKYLLNQVPPDSNKYDHIWDLRCGECWEWCNNSGQYIQCEGCGQPYHIYCLNPPLERKPNKDVIWVCSDCISKDNLHFENTDNKEEELPCFKSKVPASNYESFANSLLESSSYKNHKQNPDNWWFQYFGSFIVNNIESCVTFDCPFPFKTNRLGISKYQYKFQDDESTTEKKLSKQSTPESSSFLSSENTLNSQNEDGILERGDDDTVTVLWRWDKTTLDEQSLDTYMEKCIKTLPSQKEFSSNESNFRDYICKALIDNDYDVDKAFSQCEANLSRKFLGIPAFDKRELEIFEKEVAKYGSELKPVCKAMETQPMSMVVKYFYLWKKTEQGLKVRGKWEKKLKAANLKKNPKLGKEWKHIDDSSVELDNLPKETTFDCSFCKTDFSPMWYKITGCSTEVAKDSTEPPHLESLCIRCARLWRRYAVRWDTPSNVLKALHGNTAAVYRSNVADILSDQSETHYTIKAPSSLAFQKKIEWELILDSELIVKQRENMISDTTRAGRYRKGMLNVRSTMTKSLLQLVDNSNTNSDVMGKKLDKYINKIEKKTQPKSTNTSEAQTKPEEPSVKLESKKPEPKTSTPALNKRSVKAETLDSTSNGINKLNFLKLTCMLPNNDKCELLVDPDFKTLRITNISDLFKNKTESVFEPIIPSISNEPVVQDFLQKMKYEQSALDSYRKPVFLDDSKDAILKVYHEYALEALKDSAPSIAAAKKIKPKSTSYRANLISKSTTNTNNLRTSCSVCMGKMSPIELEEEELICHNCGMNCHYYCYGKSQDHVGQKWLCDPCSNDVETVMNQDYRCTLCVSKEIDYEACRKLLDTAIPDALKRTDNNKWAHVICALFQPGVSVGNPSLQPLQHIKNICRGHKCSICDNSSGSVAKCTFCENRFHITCAQDEEKFQLGFISEEESEPVLVCPVHETPKLLPLTHRDGEGKTLWQKHLQRVINTKISSADYKNSGEEPPHKCPRCGTNESIYWYKDDVCRSCYIDELYPESRRILKVAKPVSISQFITPLTEEQKEKYLAGIDKTKFQTHFMKTKIKTNNKKRSLAEENDVKIQKKIKN